MSRWTILSEPFYKPLGNRRRLYVSARCECGVERDVLKHAIESGASRSCGCLRSEIHAELCRARGGTTLEKTLERFWKSVTKTETCWLWANPSRSGYGSFFAFGGYHVAHRWLYQQVVGPVPRELVMDHLCRNRACVNPDHLEPVTPRENSRRSPLVFPPACAHGHAYVDGSYRVTSTGRRQCKECDRIRGRERYRQQAAQRKEGAA